MAKGKMDLSTFVGKLLEEQDGDVLREGIRVLSQALMESEVAGSSARTATSARATGRPTATGIGCGRGTRGWGRSSWRSRSCGQGATSRRCWSRAGGRSGRCWRWSRKRTSTACRRGRSTSCCGPWGSTGCRSPRCRGSAPSSTATSRRFAAAGSRASTRTCGSMRPTTRCARTGACSAWRRWSRSAWRRRASGRFWAWMPARRRIVPSGRRFSAAW